MQAEDDEDDDPVTDWLNFARFDLRSARTLLADDEVPPPIPCFHAQQSVEKAIKAVLVAHGINPPKVHVLGKLYEVLPEQVKPSFDPDDLEALDPWAVAGRYPGDVPDISHDRAGELTDLAERVLTSARTLARAVQAGEDGAGDGIVAGDSG